MIKENIAELIDHIHLTNKRFSEKQISDTGLTIKQYYILKQLEKKSITPSKIAEIIYADRPTVTVIINNLKKKNLITGEQNINDKRSIIIKITDEGLLKLKESKRKKHYKINLTSCLTNDEKTILKKLLNKVSNNLSEKINNNSL